VSIVTNSTVLLSDLITTNVTPYKPGVINLFETESYFLVQIHAKGNQFDAHTSEIKFAKLVFKYVTFNRN